LNFGSVLSIFDNITKPVWSSFWRSANFSNPASSIDIVEQQASSLVSANKIDGHVFDDVKETDIAIKNESIVTILDKLSRCVAERIDTDSTSLVCSALNLVVQNNR
jgi:hypothetical protein